MGEVATDETSDAHTITLDMIQLHLKGISIDFKCILYTMVLALPQVERWSSHFAELSFNCNDLTN